MGAKVSQRTVYLVTAAIVASMVAGFSMAQLQLGQTNTSYQGSQTTTVTALPGLSWVSTNLVEVPSSLVYTGACETYAAACVVTATGATLCAGSFNASLCRPSDFVEQVTLTTVTGTSFTGATTYPVNVTLTVYVTGTPVGGVQGTYVGPTFYFIEAASPTASNVVLDFDIGATPAGPGTVTSVSVLATTYL